MPSESLDPKQEPANPYEDVAEVSEHIDNVTSTDKFSRSFFEASWARNIFFLAGAHWLKRVGGRWEKRNLPTWFPKSQTNKFYENHSTLVTALLRGGRVPITYVPATSDEADMGTAEVGERLREVIYTEAEADEQSQTLATWLVATGNAFGIPHYDMDPSHGTKTASFQDCQDCGERMDPEELTEGETCPHCGSPNLAPATAEGDQLIAHEYPIGAIKLDVCGPFEIRGDHRIPDVRKWRRFVRQKRYDLAFAKQQWPDFKDKIVPDGGTDDTSQFYLDIFANLTSDFAFGAGLSSNSAQTKNPKVTAYEIYELPSEEFPEGLRAVRLGKNQECVVEAGPIPTEYGAGVKAGQKFLPLIHWGLDIVPGRLWRKTPLDDLVPLQLFRNVIEANIRLSIQRMGNSLWLLPKGSGVDILTGEPGQTIPYNPVSVGGTQFAKPERVPADLSGLQALAMYLKIIDDSMERISGAFFLQGGTAPPGVTAASALAYLGEKSEQSLSTMRSGWAKGWREFDMMALELARANWDDDRMRAVAGKNRKWQVEKFSKADIQGAVNFIIDWNALAPKSNATERATIGQLIQLGIVNPQDQEMQIEVLKKFGELQLKGSLDIDIEDAAKEQDRFIEDPAGANPVSMPQVRPFVDNSTVHLREHVDFAKTDEFRELPMERQQAWYGHIQNTVLDITTRRMMLTQAGLDPDVPALAEVPSAAAAVAAQAAEQAQQMVAAAQQNGGVPNGAEGPDPRLSADGTSAPTPDIAAAGMPAPADSAAGEIPDTGAQLPSSVTPPGSPRRIDMPGQ